MQKIYSVEKIMPCVFFQKWLKNGKLWKIRKRPIERFSKTLNWTFTDFFYFQFFNHFEKIHEA